MRRVRGHRMGRAVPSGPRTPFIPASVVVLTILFWETVKLYGMNEVGEEPPTSSSFTSWADTKAPCGPANPPLPANLYKAHRHSDPLQAGMAVLFNTFTPLVSA